MRFLFELHAQQRAQHILARLYGFNDWTELVESSNEPAEPQGPNRS